MTKPIRRWMFAAALLAAGAALAGQAAPQVAVVPVSEKVFLITGLADEGNAAFLVTDQGVLVVDSGGGPADGRLICQKIAETTDQPVRLVVLTHYHGDHVWGLQGFPAAALVVAQANLPKNLKRDGDEIAAVLGQLPARIAALKASLAKLGKRKAALRQKEEKDLAHAEERLAFYQQLRLVTPQLTVEAKLAFRLGGEAVEIIFPGPAHTDDNLLVFFPGQKVIHMGDMLFYRNHPYIDGPAGSDTANWIKALQDIQNWPLAKVIPGHGALTDKPALAEQARYLIDLRAAVAAARRQGLTLEQAKKSVALPAWEGLGFSDMLPFAIEAVYQELGKQPQ